jgi:uncharacterized protein (DUF952 family)
MSGNSAISETVSKGIKVPVPRLLFKILTGPEWLAFRATGIFHGAPVDLRDGFIHFSYADQVHETAGKHFAGMSGLVLIAVDPAAFGEALKDEVSRGGKLFPHLFAPLPIGAVLWEKPIGLDGGGLPVLPPLEA